MSNTSDTVGRQELTKHISASAAMTQKQAGEVLEAVLEGIKDALVNGKEVRLVGFGSFKIRTTAARRGVSPGTRKVVEIPAKRRVRFTPGKDLSEKVL